MLSVTDPFAIYIYISYADGMQMQPVRCQGCKDAATPWTHLIKDLKVVEANLLADWWENKFWDSCYLLIYVVSSYDFSHTLIASYLSLHAAACCHKMLEVLAVFFQSRHQSVNQRIFRFLHSPAFSVVDTPSSEQESLGPCLKLLAKRDPRIMKTPVSKASVRFILILRIRP